MRYIVALLLLLGAHFNLTAFVPGEPGKALFYWPWAADSKPIFGFLSSSLQDVLTPLLAAVAGVALVCAFLGLFGWVVPASWWSTLVLAGSLASILLFVMYFGPMAVIPLIVDVVLLAGLFAFGWSIEELRGQ